MIRYKSITNINAINQFTITRSNIFFFLVGKARLFYFVVYGFFQPKMSGLGSKKNTANSNRTCMCELPRCTVH